MLKPSKATIQAAFAKDAVLQRYDEDVAEYRQLEAARIKAVRQHLKGEWLKYAELKAAAKLADGNRRAALYRNRNTVKGLKIRRQPLRTLAGKIQTRKKLITKRVEKDWLKQQQLEFRRQFNTLSQKQDITTVMPTTGQPLNHETQAN